MESTGTRGVREAAVAGLFYPASASEVTREVDRFTAVDPVSGEPPKALIVPHAGYVYSGAVAGRAYASLSLVRDRVSRVVLVGPVHRVPIRGLGAPTVGRFSIPIGDIALDTTTIDALVEQFDFVNYTDSAHAAEHALEVHLPFLKRGLNDFELVPLVAGDTSYDEVDSVLEAVWGGDETLIVISSDLTHYLDYDAARRIDIETARAIESLEPEMIGHHQACGRLPIGGMLRAARRHGLRVTRADLRNSGDTAGPRDRVVGYGAWLLH